MVGDAVGRIELVWLSPLIVNGDIVGEVDDSSRVVANDELSSIVVEPP